MPERIGLFDTRDAVITVVGVSFEGVYVFPKYPLPLAVE